MTLSFRVYKTQVSNKAYESQIESPIKDERWIKRKGKKKQPNSNQLIKSIQKGKY